MKMSKAIPYLTFKDRSYHLVRSLRLGARLSFSLTLILIPFRYRFTLAARPLPPVYGDFTDFLLFASDLGMIATLVFWLLSLLIQPQPVKIGPGFISVPIMGILVASLISTFTSVDAALSIYHFIRLILLFGFYLYVVNEVTTLEQLALPVAVQVLIQALVGVSQYLSQRSLGLLFLGELELDPAWSGVSVVWADGVRALRSYGLTDHPNLLGGSLTFGLILLAGWVGKGETPPKPLTTSVFALGLLALFLTFSRSAWLGMAVGMLILAEGLRRSRDMKALSTWLGLMGAGLVILLPFIWQNAGFLGVRLNVGDSFTQITFEGRSISERRELNSAANQIFVANAIDGVGLGSFPTAISAEKPDVPYNYQPPHFALLEAAAETGIFGALFYFLLLVSPWLAVWFNRRRIRFGSAFLTACGLLAAITVIGLFDYYPWLLAPGRLWQTLIWGSWSSIYLQSVTKNNHD